MKNEAAYMKLVQEFLNKGETNEAAKVANRRFSSKRRIACLEDILSIYVEQAEIVNAIDIAIRIKRGLRAEELSQMINKILETFKKFSIQ